MNRFLPILLAILVMLPTLTKLGVIGNYWIQYQTYSQELCENKDNLEMSCNGKCQLVKEMKQANETIPFSLPNSISFKEFPAISDSYSDEKQQLSEIKAIVYSTFTPELVSGMNKDVFHPPC